MGKHSPFYCEYHGECSGLWEGLFRLSVFWACSPREELGCLIHEYSVLFCVGQLEMLGGSNFGSFCISSSMSQWMLQRV